MGKTQHEESEATNKHNSSNTNQILDKTNERPGWLPEGWNVDLKTRKSGSSMGCGYKCYINPLGKKFYSKLEVFRYLESIKANSCTSKMQEESNTMHSPSNDVGEKSSIEKSTGEKSRIEKSTAEKFMIGKSTAEKPSVDRPITDKSTDEDLPPGWIKEVNVRKSGSSNKKDVFYTDPVSGYVFRSKKDALRYIESGDISSCAIKPNKRKIQDEDKLAPTSAGKKQKQKQSATKQQHFVGESGLLENGVANPPMMQKISDPDDVQENCSNPSLSKKELGHRSSQRLARVKSDQSTNNLPNEQILPVEKRNLRSGRTALDSNLANKSSQQLNGVPQMGEDEDNKEGHQFPCRSSKRLAGFEAELTSNSLSYERASEYKSKRSRGKVNADLHHSAVELVEPASINRESSNKSRKSSRIPPVASDQLEKHENENMNDETSEPQQSFAFHYSWSDPSLEFAINTLTGTLPVEDLVVKSPTVISKTDKFPENNLSEYVTGSSKVKKRSKDKRPKVNSSSSKNKKELTTPTRLSKRLAGHEPEVLPAERALEYSTRKSCKDKPNANVISTNGESAHLHAKESTPIVPASDKLKTNKCGESLNDEKSYDAEIVPNEQLQSLEAEITNDERSETQFPLQFGDPWSDPCVEFAIKTLTGALPVDADAVKLPVVTPDADAVKLPVVTPDADAVKLPVVTPDANGPPKKEMLENVVQKSDEAAHDNSNHCQTKEELNTVCQPSKQLLDQPEFKTSSTSFENDPTFVAQESCSAEGNITMNLDGGRSLHTGGVNMTQIDINTLFFDEQFMEDEQLLGGESMAEQQPEIETTNQDNSEREFCASFMDSWSDPCLEFAFKTLTGALPIEENIPMQDCFQEPANTHEKRDGSSKLPEIGSSSISQGEKVEKFMPDQQAPMNSSFFPPEIPSSNGSTEVDAQKHYSQWNNASFQRR